MNIKKILVGFWSILVVSFAVAVEQKISVTQINGFTQAVVASSPVQIVNNQAVYSYMVSNLVVSGAGNNWVNNTYTNAGNNSYVCSTIYGHGGPSWLTNCIIDRVSNTGNCWRLRTYLTPTTNQLYTYYTNSFLIGQWVGTITANASTPAPLVSWQIITNTLASSVNTPTLESVTDVGNTTTNGIIVDSANQFSSTIGGFLTTLGLSVREGTATSANTLGSHAEGNGTIASGYYSHSAGKNSAAYDDYSWIWNGNNTTNFYNSNGQGTFNINPVGGLNGFYIGTTNLNTILINLTNGIVGGGGVGDFTKLISFDTNTIMIVSNGVGYITYVTTSINISSNVIISNTYGYPYSGPSVGTIYSDPVYDPINNLWRWTGLPGGTTLKYLAYLNGLQYWQISDVAPPSMPVTSFLNSPGSPFTLPASLVAWSGIVSGSLQLNWLVVTNVSTNIFSVLVNNQSNVTLGTNTTLTSAIVSSNLYIGVPLSPTSGVRFLVNNNTVPPSNMQNWTSSKDAYILGSDGESTRLIIDANGPTATPLISFRVSGGTAANPSAVTGGNNIFSLGVQGYGSTGYNNNATRFFEAAAVGTWTDTIKPYIMKFFGTNTNGQNSIRMTITPDGTVKLASSDYSDQGGGLKSYSTWGTNLPSLLVESFGATAGGWNTNGTGFGVNSVPGFVGNLLDLHNNGVQKAFIDYNGDIYSGPGPLTNDPNIRFMANANTVAPKDFAVYNNTSNYPFNFVGADNHLCQVSLNSYGSGQYPKLLFVSANGTAASPSATTSFNLLANLAIQGYGTSSRSNGAYTGRAFMNVQSYNGASWTDTNQGYMVTILTGPQTAPVTQVTRQRWYDDGGIELGGVNDMSSTSPGAGIVQIDSNLVVKGSISGSISPSQVSTVPISLPYVLTNIPNFSDGLYRNCTMTNDMVLYGPTNATYGVIWTCYLFATNGNRNLSFPTTVLVPSDSGFTSPKVLTSNLTYIVQMRYGLSMSGTNWLLNSVVGGF